MDKLHSIIGPDCIDIIMDYKKEFERIEYNHKQIEKCIFEEFDKDIFKQIDNGSTNFIKEHYLNDFSINDFQNYSIDENFFMNTTLKFTIVGNIYYDRAEDSLQINLENINSSYLKNLNVEYIYKLNDFNLCLYLGTFRQNQIEELYINIARDFITGYQIVVD